MRHSAAPGVVELGGSYEKHITGDRGHSLRAGADALRHGIGEGCLSDPCPNYRLRRHSSNLLQGIVWIFWKKMRYLADSKGIKPKNSAVLMTISVKRASAVILFSGITQLIQSIFPAKAHIQIFW